MNNNSLYKNCNLSIEERVADLLSRMNPLQKVAQLQCMLLVPGYDIPIPAMFPNGLGAIGFSHGSKTATEMADKIHAVQEFMLNQTELGIPTLAHCEALSGGVFPEADIFPVAIGLGATWNEDNLKAVGQITAKQMKAVGFRHALSPNLDICRDPRWGRISECYSEDPTLVSELGCAFIAGLQGPNMENGISATAKHYFGYAAGEAGLNMAPSTLSDREINETHLKPFQAAITETALGSVMNSYSVVNGEAISNSQFYLKDVLREQLGFDGVVISDYASVEKLVTTYNICETIPEAGISAIKAGIDIEAPIPNTYRAEIILAAIQQGILKEEVLNEAVANILRLKFRLGLFENPYPEIENIKNFHEQYIVNAVKKATKESLVLLKNEDNFLPLENKLKKIAIIGPEADSIRALYGAYTYPAAIELTIAGMLTAQPGMKDLRQLAEDMENSPGIKPIKGMKEDERLQSILREMYPMATTIREELCEKWPNAEILYAKGCDYSHPDTTGFSEAIAIAKQADIVILAIGGKNGWGGACTIGEGIDSQNIGLPGVQENLALEIMNVNPNAVVIHLDGRPLSSEAIVNKAPAILEAWQPSTYGAEILVATLLGEYNPAGRLPFTTARYAGQLPVYYNMKNGAGNKGLGDSAIFADGYIDGTSEPLYWFGHGLSYSTFEYSDMQLSCNEISGNGEMEASVTITNTSEVDGDEVVQLYIADPIASVVRPVKDLVGFRRIHLHSGESKKIKFKWKLSQMAFLDLNMNWKVERGTMNVEIGASAFDIRQQGTFEITEDFILNDGKERGFYARTEII